MGDQDAKMRKLKAKKMGFGLPNKALPMKKG